MVVKGDYTAFHNNVQNYAITELRHKRVYGCRKKMFEYRNVFLTTTIYRLDGSNDEGKCREG